jgi:Putative beta-barrel porin-2, OmpL-like. bbp2
MRHAVLVTLLLAPDVTNAEEAPPPATLEERVRMLEQKLAEAEAAKSDGHVKAATKATLTIGGYVEAFWQWNVNNPDNFVTNYRGFDNRHNMFTLDNVVLDLVGTYGAVSTHIALQIGNTPNAYYLSEPVWRATSGAGPSSPAIWQNIQQANVAYVAPVGAGLTLDMGVFLSPIGPEGMAIKDQWNWSRSNLFFGLPFYHSGMRATYPVTPRLTASLQLYNGWNNIVDSNLQLSPAAQLVYTIPDELTLAALYFGGVERLEGAPEGSSWRHLFDTYAIWTPRPDVQLLAHVDAGFERNDFGTSSWYAGALGARWKARSWLYVAGRGDYFHESVARDENGSASPIFWAGAKWMSSGTLTLDTRPNDNMSVRLEYRHDQSQAPLFFAGDVATDADGNYVPDAKSQDTITVGVVAWF